MEVDFHVGRDDSAPDKSLEDHTAPGASLADLRAAPSMRLIARRTIRDFIDAGHGDIAGALTAWAAEVEKADWKGPVDIKRRYASASFVGDELVVFNLGGNKYRVVVKVKYAPSALVFIKFIGTHAEYDKLILSAL